MGLCFIRPRGVGQNTLDRRVKRVWVALLTGCGHRVVQAYRHGYGRMVQSTECEYG